VEMLRGSEYVSARQRSFCMAEKDSVLASMGSAEKTSVERYYKTSAMRQDMPFREDCITSMKSASSARSLSLSPSPIAGML
jgi:hypothetical protein